MQRQLELSELVVETFETGPAVTVLDESDSLQNPSACGADDGCTLHPCGSEVDCGSGNAYCTLDCVQPSSMTSIYACCG